jgi:hypothetical protein
MNTVTTALHQGWTISKAATVLAHGANDEGQGYLLTLSSPSADCLREYFVLRSPDVETLLENEHLLMAGSLS